MNTARRTIKGYEAMNLIRKGQIKDADRGDVVGQGLMHQRNLRNRVLNKEGFSSLPLLPTEPSEATKTGLRKALRSCERHFRVPRKG